MRVLITTLLFAFSMGSPQSDIWCSQSSTSHDPSVFKNYFTGTTSDYVGIYQVSSQASDILHIVEIGVADGQWFATKRVYATGDSMPLPSYLADVNILNSEFRTATFKAKFKSLRTQVNGRTRVLHGFVIEGGNLFYCQNE
jgi:hypothetical protein